MTMNLYRPDLAFQGHCTCYMSMWHLVLKQQITFISPSSVESHDTSVARVVLNGVLTIKAFAKLITRFETYMLVFLCWMHAVIHRPEVVLKWICRVCLNIYKILFPTLPSSLWICCPCGVSGFCCERLQGMCHVCPSDKHSEYLAVINSLENKPCLINKSWIVYAVVPLLKGTL